MQILVTFLLIFLNSIQLVFSHVLVEEFRIIKLCVLTFYVVELMVDMLTVKKVEGRRFEVLRDIWEYLGPEKIVMNLINILIIVFDVSFDMTAVAYLRLFILFKLPQVLQTLQ